MNSRMMRWPHPVPPAVWPVPGMMMCFEFDSVAATCSPQVGGVTGSTSPDSTSVGMADFTGS